MNFRSSFKSINKKPSSLETGAELKERALEEIKKIDHDDSSYGGVPMTPTNRDRNKLGEFLNELLDEDLIPLERLKELKKKENGGFSCYSGSEYIDEEY